MRKVLVIATANNVATTVLEKMNVVATVEDGIGHLTINGTISELSQNNTSLFKASINILKNKNVKKVIVKLNTKGGDVFAAREMANALEENFESVTIKVGALAASAGTYLTSKFYSTGKPNSQFMIHKPMAGVFGNNTQIKSTLKLLEDTTKDYIKTYAEKTGKATNQIKELFDKGDYWMTAQEALKEGFINAIEGDDAVITEKTQAMLVACGAPVTPKVNTNTQINTNKMDKELLIAQLGLPADATDADIKAEIKRLKDAEVQAVADAKATKEAEVKAFLDKAEQDKKFTPELRASYEAMAETNFDHTKKIVDALPVAQAPSASVQTRNTPEVNAERKEWTLKDYQEKDPEAFAKLSDEKQQELADAYYSQND